MSNRHESGRTYQKNGRPHLTVLEGGANTSSQKPNYLRRRLTALSLIAGVALSALTYDSKDTPAQSSSPKIECAGTQQYIIDSPNMTLLAIADRVSKDKGMVAEEIVSEIKVSSTLNKDLVAPNATLTEYTYQNGYRVLNDSISDTNRAERARDGQLNIGEVVNAPIQCAYPETK